MTTAYTGVNGGTFPNTITGPAAGEFVTAASVGLVAQGAADELKYLYDAITRIAYTDTIRGFNGRFSRGVARVVVADGNKTLGVVAGAGIDYSGRRFELDATPGAVRTITIDKVTAVPTATEVIECFIPGAVPTGQQYIFKRNDGTSICEFWGNDESDGGMWAEFVYEGSVWRLGRNSGCYSSPDYTGTHGIGVLPKAGA